MYINLNINCIYIYKYLCRTCVCLPDCDLGLMVVAGLGVKLPALML
jgi:hypothetical protein